MIIWLNRHITPFNSFKHIHKSKPSDFAENFQNLYVGYFKELIFKLSEIQHKIKYYMLLTQKSNTIHQTMAEKKIILIGTLEVFLVLAKMFLQSSRRLSYSTKAQKHSDRAIERQKLIRASSLAWLRSKKGGGGEREKEVKWKENYCLYNQILLLTL